MNLFVLEAEASSVLAGDTGSLVGSIAVLVLFFVAMYFFMIRPQRKKEKELNKQISAMEVGDKVVTIGGFVGTVANISGDEVTISTSTAYTLVTLQKNAISTITKRNAPAPEEKKN